MLGNDAQNITGDKKRRNDRKNTDKELEKKIDQWMTSKGANSRSG